jgi:hypothetical protein
VDLPAVVDAGRDLLDEGPRTRAELRDALGPRFPTADPTALAQAVTFLIPVIQVPPRALWRRSGQARWATIESWLGRPLAANEAPDGLVLRYLAAFGPATAADVRAWSGLTEAAAILDRLRPMLIAFRDEAGRELLDLPDAPRPDADTPAPVRYLPVYDNVILSHADRGRIIDDRHRRAALNVDAVNFGSILVDGFARAVWRIDRHAGSVILDVAVLEDLAPPEITAVEDEGARLLAFLESSAEAREVRIRRLSTA